MKLSELHTPIKYKLSDIKKIMQYSHDWDHKECEYFKDILRARLENEFDNICFYCRRPLDTSTFTPEIDHILYKSKYNYYSFRPENLVLCCKNCNTNKSRKDVLSPSSFNTNGKYYFRDYNNYESDDFLIIHPYYDEYANYIDLVDNLFLISKDDNGKGKETIETCNLFRLNLTENRMKEIKGNEDGLISSIVNRPEYNEIVNLISQQELEDIYSVIKDRVVKDTAQIISDNKAYNLIIGESATFINYYKNNKIIVDDFIKLYSKAKNLTTLTNAISEHKNNVNQSSIDFELSDLLNINLIKGFKVEYTQNRISRRIYSKHETEILTIINSIYDENTFGELKRFLDNIESTKMIIKLLKIREIKEKLSYFDSTLIRKINSVSNVLLKYLDINKNFYSIALIPHIVEAYDILDRKPEIYEDIKVYKL